MSIVALSDQARTRGGRFSPGHSGNPAGRPKGARNRATLAAEAMLAEAGDGLVGKLIERGLKGDGAALRFLVGRLCPANAGRSINLDLAPGREGDFLHIHEMTVRAMADGEITPQEALVVARVLAVGMKLVQFRQRLSKLAAAAAPDPQTAAATPPAVRHADARPRAKPAGKGELPARPHVASSSGGAADPGQADAPPVSRLYFSHRTAGGSRAPLYASTALGRIGAGTTPTCAPSAAVPPLDLFSPVNLCGARSTARLAA